MYDFQTHLPITGPVVDVPMPIKQNRRPRPVEKLLGPSISRDTTDAEADSIPRDNPFTM